jgi:hypothetical protein
MIYLNSRQLKLALRTQQKFPKNENQTLEMRVALKNRDGSRDVVSGNERQDSDLRETSVVELARSLSIQSRFADTREVDSGEDHCGERTTFRVVNILGLGDHLGDEDSGEDLCLASDGDRRPCIRRGHGREGFEANVTGEHAREVDSGSVDEVSGGGNHSHASVLELGGAHPEEGLITSEGGEL